MKPGATLYAEAHDCLRRARAAFEAATAAQMWGDDVSQAAWLRVGIGYLEWADAARDAARKVRANA